MLLRGQRGEKSRLATRRTQRSMLPVNVMYNDRIKLLRVLSRLSFNTITNDRFFFFFFVFFLFFFRLLSRFARIDESPSGTRTRTSSSNRRFRQRRMVERSFWFRSLSRNALEKIYSSAVEHRSLLLSAVRRSRVTKSILMYLTWM